MMHNFENVHGNTSASPKRNMVPKIAEEKVASAQVADMQWDAAQDKSHASERSFGQRHANQQNQQRVPALSLYDLANMPLQPSNQPVRRFGPGGSTQSQYRSQGNISQNSGNLRPDSQPKAMSRPLSASKALDSLGAKEEDPLAAFGGFGGGGMGTGHPLQQQQHRGGPVRSNPAARRPGSAPVSSRLYQQPSRSRAAGRADAKYQDLGLEGRSVASNRSVDSYGSAYRREGSNASIRSLESKGSVSGARRLTPRKGVVAEPKKVAKTGWR